MAARPKIRISGAPSIPKGYLLGRTSAGTGDVELIPIADAAKEIARTGHVSTPGMGGGITQLTGDITAGAGVGSQAATLATVNSNVGSFTLASITVNAKGLVTAAASGTSGSSGTVTSVAATVPASSILAVSGSPITTSGTLAIATTGTSGGVPYFFDANTLKTSAALTANLPVIGGGAGAAPSVGSRSGNTTVFATTSGGLTNGHTAAFDASGNIVDGGAPSGGGVTSIVAGTGLTGGTITTTGTISAAQMAAHTFKGNNTGLTADPIDLSATQLTAELNAVVGDTGSGGTKGLVPAPGSGDTAAGKFLKADGTFAVPAGTGASSTLTSAHLFVGNGSNIATDVAVTGDVTITNTGVTAIGSAKVTDAMLASTFGSKLVGSTQTASNSASLSWTGLSGTHWKLAGRLLIPATSNVVAALQFGTGATPTYVTAGYYLGAAMFGVTGAFSATPNTSNVAQWQIYNDVQNTAPGISFEAEIFTDNATFVHIVGKATFKANDNNYYGNTFSGVAATSAAVTAFKFFQSAGNITSGTLSLYLMAT